VLARLRFAACDVVASSASGGVAVPFIGSAGMVLTTPVETLLKELRGAALVVGGYRGRERGGVGGEVVGVGTHPKGLTAWRMLAIVSLRDSTRENGVDGVFCELAVTL
jgi:hypothetical protein